MKRTIDSRYLSATTFLVCVLLMVFLPYETTAQQPGLAFLRLTADAAGAARGGAVTATGAGITAVQWNPAGLVAGGGNEVSVSHINGFEDTDSEYFGFLWKRSEKHAVAVSLLSNNIDGIEFRTKPTAAPEAYISAHDLYAGITYSRVISGSLQAGATVKYLYQKIYSATGSGLAGDAGIRYTPAGRAYSAGLVIRNIGSMGALDTEKPTLPALMRAGAAYRIEFDSRIVEISGDYEVIFDGDNHTYVGADYSHKGRFHIGAGYVSGYDSGRATFGGGMRIRGYAVDYAWLPDITTFGNQHVFTVGWIF